MQHFPPDTGICPKWPQGWCRRAGATINKLSSAEYRRFSSVGLKYPLSAGNCQLMAAFKPKMAPEWMSRPKRNQIKILLEFRNGGFTTATPCHLKSIWAISNGRLWQVRDTMVMRAERNFQMGAVRQLSLCLATWQGGEHDLWPCWTQRQPWYVGKHCHSRRVVSSKSIKFNRPSKIERL